MLLNLRPIVVVVYFFTVMYLLFLDWWSTDANRSNVVTRNYMQTNMPGKYVYYYIELCC